VAKKGASSAEYSDCTALHCTALHCTALHCTALHCTALLCILRGRPSDLRSRITAETERTAHRFACARSAAHVGAPLLTTTYYYLLRRRPTSERHPPPLPFRRGRRWWTRWPRGCRCRTGRRCCRGSHAPICTGGRTRPPYSPGRGRARCAGPCCSGSRDRR